MLSSQRNRTYSPQLPTRSSTRTRTLFRWTGSILILAGLIAGYFSFFSDNAPISHNQPATSLVAIAPDSTNPPTLAPPLQRPTTLNLPSLSSQASAPTPTLSAPTTQPASPQHDTSPTTASSTQTDFILPASSSNLSSVDLADRFQQGMSLIEQKKLVQGRQLLSSLLIHSADQLAPHQTQAIRETLTSANNDLIFSDRIHHDDPLVEAYTVKPNDLLVRIAPRYKIPYQIIEQINNVDARRIRAGQTLKLVKGPFFAVVHKSDYRIDLFLTSPQGQPLYIRSFPVGLGKTDSTPLGLWAVAAGGKVSNPGWTSPRTNKYFAPDNQANPIGEYWIGLEGLDDNTKGKRGYGIHGTIEPESIGKQASLGCVRLKPDDIAQLYKLLVERRSLVRIEP